MSTGNGFYVCSSLFPPSWWSTAQHKVIEATRPVSPVGPQLFIHSFVFLPPRDSVVLVQFIHSCLSLFQLYSWPVLLEWHQCGPLREHPHDYTMYQLKYWRAYLTLHRVWLFLPFINPFQRHHKQLFDLPLFLGLYSVMWPQICGVQWQIVLTFQIYYNWHRLNCLSQIW